MPPFDDFTDAPLDRSWIDTAGSALGTGWRWLTTPLVPQIQQTSRGISDAITGHHSGESMFGSMARGALGGMVEGVGNVLGDFTSPLGIATAAAPKLISGIRGMAGAGRAAQEALGGRSAADILLGGPTTEAQAADILLGKGPREPNVDELIQQLNRAPQGSRDVTRAAPFGRAVIDAQPEEIAARSARPPAADPFIRGPQPSGAATDPLDPRFSNRPQGIGAAEYERDPFASDLDAAVQPAFSDAPLEQALRDLDAEPGPYTAEPPAPVEDLGSSVPQDALSVLRRQFEEAPGSAVETGAGPVTSTAPVASPETPAPPASPASPTDVISRFFRMNEAPYSASGKRRLLPEEVTREQGLRDSGLGEERGVPSVPSQFRASTGPGGDPDIEWITRSGRYNDLPWGERQAAIAQDERFNHLLGDESGFIDTSQLPALADQANKLRYFSMLSSPATQAKNILGNIGAVGSHAAETALSGKPREAMRVLGEFFNPQTVRDAISEYRAPGVDGRWGSESGALGVPGRIMGAIDRGTKDALSRAGVDPALAEEITFTNRPKSEAGQAFGDALNRSSIGKLLVPFSKTATNILERGIERTPILGSIAERVSGGNLPTSLPKQIMGGAAMAAGAALNHSDPYVDALLAPYSVPYSMGSGMATAAEKAGSTSADVIQAFISRLGNAAPLPTKDYTLDPRQYIASYVPNILRDASTLTGTDPSSFDTGRHSGYPMFAKAIAKIPFFNELLLHHKSAAAPAAKGSF